MTVNTEGKRLSEDYYPFKDAAEEQAYIKEKGLDRYACSKHGLDYIFSCPECHDQWQRWVGQTDVTVVSSYGSTSRDHLKENQEE